MPADMPRNTGISEGWTNRTLQKYLITKLDNIIENARIVKVGKEKQSLFLDDPKSREGENTVGRIASVQTETRCEKGRSETKRREVAERKKADAENSKKKIQKCRRNGAGKKKNKMVKKSEGRRWRK